MRDKLAEVVRGAEAIEQRGGFGSALPQQPNGGLSAATASLGQGGCGGVENEKRQPKGDCRRLLQAAVGGYMRV